MDNEGDELSLIRVMDEGCDDLVGGTSNLDDELYPELSYLLVGDLAFMTNGEPNTRAGMWYLVIVYCTIVNLSSRMYVSTFSSGI